MPSLFQHHPDGRIKIVSDDQVYLETLENFLLDYGSDYPGLPAGTKGFFYEPGRRAYAIADNDTQIAVAIDTDYLQKAIRNVDTILSNQQTRLNAESTPEVPVEPNPNEIALKDIADRIGLDTTTDTWRDELFVRIAQAVFEN